MGQAYDLRSNIKGKPGSQGTLFQVTDKGLLSPEQRWPRGYTPERQNEVRSALRDTVVMGGGHGWNPEEIQRQNPTAQPDFRSRPGPARRHPTPPTRYALYPHSEARVVDAISQSTIPPRHLKGLELISGQMDQHEQARGTQAYYMPNSRELHIPMHHPDKERTAKNIVHEIGHHVHGHLERGKETANIADDIAVGLYPEIKNKANAGFMYRPGVEEARADNYYAEHYKPRGRKGEVDPTRPGRYEDNFPDPKVREKHFAGYNQVREPKMPEELHPDQFHGLFREVRSFANPGQATWHHPDTFEQIGRQG